MRKLSTGLFVCLLLLACTSSAQIPNAGFESWTGTEPDGWVSSNVSVVSVFPVTKSADAHGGSSSLRGEVVIFPGTGKPFGPVIQSGADALGFPVSVRYSAVNGYYKFSPVSGDRLGLNFAMMQGGVTIAQGAQAITVAASNWTQFAVPLTYTGRGVPDTCILQILLVGPVTGPDYHTGSFFLLDDLSFGPGTGVDADRSPLSYTLAQNFPNPFNPATVIQYSIAERGHVNLNVYNALGQSVAELVNTVQESGTHRVTFNGSALPSGVYFYRLQAGSFLETKRLVLVK